MRPAHEQIDAVRRVDHRLIVAIVLNAVIVIAEVSGGLLSGSLALLSDAVHNLSDVTALLVAFVARQVSSRPPSHRHTYGLGRVEVMAAVLNSAAILVVGTLIIRSAVARLLHPQPILAGVMLTVALIGLAANLISVLLLKGHCRDDLNMRGAMLHLLQDTASSLAVVIAALFATWKYGRYLDPIVSILVVLLVLFSGWRLLRKATAVLLEAVPPGLDLKALRADIEQLVPGCDLHHVHVWEIKPGQRILTAHLRMPDRLLSKTDGILRQIRTRLETEWAIDHSTLEVETVGCGSSSLLGRGQAGTNLCLNNTGSGWNG